MMCCKQDLWTDEFEYLCGELQVGNYVLMEQAKVKQDVVPRAWSYIQRRDAAPSSLESNSASWNN